MNDVTHILSAIEQGEPTGRRATPAAGLRRAAPAGRGEAGPGEARPDPPGHGPGPRGLSAAGGRGAARHWDSRRHFFAAAAEAMRRILVEQARRKRTERHGGHLHRCSLDGLRPGVRVAARGPAGPGRGPEPARGRAPGARPSWSSSATSPACRSRTRPRPCGISPATAKRRWAFARAWLFREVTDGERPSS